MENTLSNKERIWKVVELIPEGSVSSYGKIADLAGLPGRARYVSTALKQAPSSLELPWHRVLNAQGKISIPKTNPSYQAQWELLAMEGVYVKNGKVDLAEFGWKPELAELMFLLDF